MDNFQWKNLPFYRFYRFFLPFLPFYRFNSKNIFTVLPFTDLLKTNNVKLSLGPGPGPGPVSRVWVPVPVPFPESRVFSGPAQL